MKIVVTGGAGFIGSHVAAHLKSRGFDVVAVDSLERASGLGRLRAAGVPLVVADLRRDELPRGDAVVHAAAYISVEESWEKPYEYMWNNAAVTAKVGKEALRMGAYLVYLSSAAVYGNPVYTPIDEEHPTRPTSPYGLSKLAGEEALALLQSAGLKYAVARLFNVYGPGQTGPYAGVITKFIERARAGLPPVIFGSGEQTRDFIHVLDVARFVETLVEKGAQGVFNVGTGRAVSIKELAHAVMKLAGIGGEPIYASPRPGDIAHSVANIKKARGLGWEPKITLEEGLAQLWGSAHLVDSN
ncbi:MAG: NAD-dependent epimerase/dehydratase family protein [Pyrobaculum arsenaticum]|uniref:NAD-dependent epimerase/dehydratase n=2 Tax=Pyrobaculum arsenaticum TaxID=121277 RepID=A4WHT4_PYRAR|nr:NAD-dependent epimerase/dehydratase family protein [Pyrobaculum arsenaticum]ABP49951.1 NAD-dependent epimerase/dehydratase [Pyrobaculum arsenaticum DSM 13514]MCY0891522.1 NAD-dependent epimerase/dehydratase family protein [Pyrobaculum arsenaticum]NYR16635.1 NAD-dependent epimerase/dehydratase family protein [Pyrobaculum arsenaticum]